jgi:hypothetical protein
VTRVSARIDTRSSRRAYHCHNMYCSRHYRTRTMTVHDEVETTDGFHQPLVFYCCSVELTRLQTGWADFDDKRREYGQRL